MTLLTLLTLLALVVRGDDVAVVEAVPPASAPAPTGQPEVVAPPAPAAGQRQQQVGGVAVPTGPGEPATYEEIAALTDCDELQQRSDTAANAYVREEFGSPLFEIQLSYTEFADERLQALGCY